MVNQAGWRGEVPRGIDVADGGGTRPVGRAVVGRAVVPAPAIAPQRERLLAATPPMPFGPPVAPPPDPAQPAQSWSPVGIPAGRPVGPSLRRVLRASSAARLRAVAEDLRRVAQPVTTCRRIVVGGVGNGAGATTLAALLGLAFATHRRDLTLAVDASAGGGSLAYRLGDVPAWSHQDLASLAGQLDVNQAGQTVRSRGQLSVLPHLPGTAIDDYWTVSAALTRFCAVSVVDGGVSAPGGIGYPGGAHAMVLAIPATMDSVRTALAWFAGAPPQVRCRAVPVLVGDVSAGGLRRTATVRALGVEVPAACLPYDHGLAAAAPVRPRRLRQQTVDATLQIAGTALALASGAR